MSVEIHTHATKNLRFAGDVSVAARLPACKEYLRAETAGLRARHAGGASGLQVAHERAEAIDELLSRLFDYAIETYSRKLTAPPPPVALVALGGYGRSELSPLSDVDVM